MNYDLWHHSWGVGWFYRFRYIYTPSKWKIDVIFASDETIREGGTFTLCISIWIFNTLFSIEAKSILWGYLVAFALFSPIYILSHFTQNHINFTTISRTITFTTVLFIYYSTNCISPPCIYSFQFFSYT